VGEEGARGRAIVASRADGQGPGAEGAGQDQRLREGLELRGERGLFLCGEGAPRAHDAGGPPEGAARGHLELHHERGEGEHGRAVRVRPDGVDLVGEARVVPREQPPEARQHSLME